MTPLLDAVCTEIVTLLLPSDSWSDGKPRAPAQVTARGRFMAATARDIGEFGRIADSGIFLIAGGREIPAGAAVRYGSRSYQIRSVRVCRDLDGQIIASRCLVV